MALGAKLIIQLNKNSMIPVQLYSAIYDIQDFYTWFFR